MSRPRPCTGCGTKPVARKTLKFCFDCLPGGPRTPPPCRRCGRVDGYYSAGLCDRCHQYAPPTARLVFRLPRLRRDPHPQVAVLRVRRVAPATTEHRTLRLVRLRASHRTRRVVPALLAASRGRPRCLLDSDSPACAALAALVVFHGLRSIELRDLRLVDVRDGRLHVGDRAIPLAPEASHRLSRWLDHRQARWPHTANSHLFVHQGNCGNLNPAGRLWVSRTLGTAPSTLRADRILDEAIATGGDARRLCDLFDISVKTAERYTRVLDPIGLTSDEP